MKYYSLDSSAEAVLLYEKRITTFVLGKDDGRIRIENDYHARFKVLRSSGTARAIIKLPYRQSVTGISERIENIKGCTYNLEDGKIITSKLTKQSVFDEEITERSFLKTLTLPNVKVGSVFEYSYTCSTPFALEDAPKTWRFQSDIPFLWSELVITIPRSLDYKMIFLGDLKLHIKTVEKISSEFGDYLLIADKHRLVVKNAMAFHTEPFMPPKADCISKIEFQLARMNYANSTHKSFSVTWPDVHEFYSEHKNFGNELLQNDYLKDTALVLSSIKDTLARANAAFNYIARTIKWNGQKLDFALQPLKAVFENKTGNSAEINLMLVALLRMSGLHANPVIISTRGNGEILKRYPLIDKFNYTIAEIKAGSETILMDATEPLSYPGMIPVRCLSRTGVIIDKDSARFISLRPTAKFKELVTVALEIDTTKHIITGSYADLYDEYGALEQRKILEENGKDNFTRSVKENRADWQLSNIKTEGEKNNSGTFVLSFDFTSEEAMFSPTKIYLNPFLGKTNHVNPFKSESRLYPVDFIWPVDKIHIVSIKIPEGYSVEEVPKNVNIILPEKAGRFTYVVEVSDRVIKVKSEVSISKTYFLQKYYPYIKEYYATVIQKQLENIVLKKK